MKIDTFEKFTTKGYGSYIVESAGKLSDIPDERLKEYLEEDSFRLILANAIDDANDRDILTFTQDNSDGVIVPGETATFKVTKDDLVGLKVHGTLLNPKKLISGIDFGVAAKVFKDAIEYYAGTDEETIALVAASLSSIASKAGSSATPVFNEFDKELQTSYNATLSEWIDGDFDGDAEVIAMNIFKRKIETSVWRGINLGQIIFDIGLTAVTFGAGTAAQAAIKGSAVGIKAASLAGKATTAGKAIAKLTGVSKIVTKLPNFAKLGAIKRGFGIAKYIGKTKPFMYTSAAGKKLSVVLVKGANKYGKVIVKNAKSGKKLAAIDQVNFLKRIDPTVADKVLTGMKISVNPTVAGLLIDKAATAGVDASSSSSQAESWYANGAEVMGWYDSLTADPAQYVAETSTYSARELAVKIDDKANGGMFGFTSDQDELAIALIITSLTSDMAKKLDKEYTKISGETMIETLRSELDGDVETLVIPYWVSLIEGGDDELLTQINTMKSRFK